jgi:hypothetical protein
MINEKDEWGNLDLPGFSHEQLLDPNLNYVLANLARNKDPIWLAKQEEIYKSPKFKKLMGKISKQNWDNPEFQAKQHAARILAWADASEERRQQVIDQFSKPKTESHCKNLSKAQTSFYKTSRGKKVLAQKSAKQKGKSKPKITCPHCNIIGGPVMKRWHFDNCKQKGESK